jgi:hypothetical protein
MLSVNKYNEIEQEELKNISNFVIQAFQPVTFNAVNFASRISELSELWKYVDTMQELRFEDNVKNGLAGGLTADEFQIYQGLSKKIFDFSTTLNTPNFGRNAVSRSMIVLRALRLLFKESKPRVLEWGGGSGYFGGLCREVQYPYASTDISQAFYLYQNHFYNHAFPDTLLEAWDKPVDWSDSDFIHIPWWKWVDTQWPLPEFDVLICNHMISEMHPHSLLFGLNRILRNAKKMNHKPPIILFEGWGFNSHLCNRSMPFYKNGYKLHHHKGWGKGKSAPVTALSTESAKAKVSKDIQVKIEGLIHDLKYIAKRFALNRPLENYYTTDMEVTSDSKLSERLVKFDATQIKHGIEDITKMYSELSPTVPVYTRDEEFATFIGAKGL